MSRHFVTLCAVVSLLGLIGFGSGEEVRAEPEGLQADAVTECSTQGEPASDASGADKVKEFSTKVAAAKIKSGAEGQAMLTIVAGKGFKWNKEYPAKVTFEGAPKHVTLAKTQFKQFGGDFKTSEKRADVSVKMTGKAAGKETLTAKAKFSVLSLIHI